MTSLPTPHSHWIDRGSGRTVVVTGVSYDLDAWRVSYRYVQGVGGSGLWRRGVTPEQAVSVDDWQRRFTEKP